MNDRACKYFALLPKVWKIVLSDNEITVAELQTKLKIGFGTACRLLDALIALNLVKKQGETGSYKYVINTDKELTIEEYFKIKKEN